MSLARASTHFAWREFDVNHRWPLPVRRRPAYAELAAVYLEAVRRRFGRTVITSSLRTPAYNARVGGAIASTHLTTGSVRVAAVDFRCARGRPDQWAQLLDDLGCPGIGTYEDHVHADTRRGRPVRWSG